MKDDQLARAVMADPRALAARASEPSVRALVGLALKVTEAPWSLSGADLARAEAAGLDQAAVLHAVLLASYFGHLNRVADAVGIELDYPVQIAPVRAEPATPPYLRPPREAWPDPDAPRPLQLAQRPGAAEALAAWRRHALEREAPLGRPQRALIARAVAERLGDAQGVRLHEAARPAGALDEALVAMADEVTLAPWRLGVGTVAALRSAGLADDAALFDALAVATASTTFSRIEVSLAALARPGGLDNPGPEQL